MAAMWFLFLVPVVAVKAAPPIFEETFENRTFPSNVRAEIYCNASGDTPINYAWYDEFSFKVQSNSSYPIFSLPSAVGSYLVFKDTDASQNGSYTCLAKNAHGLASKIYEVFIFSEPSETPLINNISILNVTETSVTFYVYTTKSSEEVLIWFSESRDRTSNSNATRIPTFGDPELRIEMNDLVPGGKYEFQFQAVRADNEFSEKKVVSNVILLPSAPEVIFQSLKEGSLKIRWFRKTDDIMRKTLLDHLLSYRTVAFKQGGNEWDYNYSNCFTNVTIPSCGASSYTFSDLYQRVFYEFQVRARTIAGYGKPSKFKVYIE